MPCLFLPILRGQLGNHSQPERCLATRQASAYGPPSCYKPFSAPALVEAQQPANAPRQAQAVGVLVDQILVLIGI
jgi:hypothetical protein